MVTESNGREPWNHVGVRPSSGAETQEPSAAPNILTVADKSGISAGGDARTPLFLQPAHDHWGTILNTFPV
jgi:hypothetical protein